MLTLESVYCNILVTKSIKQNGNSYTSLNVFCVFIELISKIVKTYSVGKANYLKNLLCYDLCVRAHVNKLQKANCV